MQMSSLDSYIGVHATALELRSQRAELLANNLANADTPNFKARDLDFRAAMVAAEGGSKGSGALALTTTRANQLGASAGAGGQGELGGPNLKYRVPLAPSLDGNTVEAQVEQAAFAENAVRYQATLTFIGAKLRGLMTAITGQ
jgi:flagellar basal-body rod protein FlgB